MYERDDGPRLRERDRGRPLRPQAGGAAEGHDRAALRRRRGRARPRRQAARQARPRPGRRGRHGRRLLGHALRPALLHALPRHGDRRRPRRPVRQGRQDGHRQGSPRADARRRAAGQGRLVPRHHPDDGGQVLGGYRGHARDARALQPHRRAGRAAQARLRRQASTRSKTASRDHRCGAAGTAAPQRLSDARAAPALVMARRERTCPRR